MDTMPTPGRLTAPPCSSIPARSVCADTYLCLLQVGDTELAVPPPPEPAVEAPQEEEGKEEGALAQAAATEVVESSEVDTTLSVTTTEEEVAVFTMDALSAGIPIQGVEASAAASTNGTGKKVRGPTT